MLSFFAPSAFVVVILVLFLFLFLLLLLLLLFLAALICFGSLWLWL